MSGSYPDTSAATEAADAAAVESGVASEVSRVAASQAEAARFINAHGSAVTAGHTDTGVLPSSIAGNG